MTDEEAVLATFDEYAEAYCAKDTDRLMALFRESDDISLIGTGADELCAGYAEIRAVMERNFAEATAKKFNWHWRQVTLAGDGAVVAMSLTIDLETGGGPVHIPLRWTVSLQRISGSWRWLHRHASSAAGSQEDGAAYPTGAIGD